MLFNIGAIIRVPHRLYVFHDVQSYLEIYVLSMIQRRLMSAACRMRKRSTTRLKQLITTSQECPGCGQYTGGEGFPTSRPAKAKHPQVHLSGPKGFCYIDRGDRPFSIILQTFSPQCVASPTSASAFWQQAVLSRPKMYMQSKQMMPIF